MQRLNNESPTSTTIQELCEEYKRNNVITQEEYQQHRVKRGLRNADGTGVMAGLTHVCNVHGYLIADGDKIPDTGRLTYRGIDIGGHRGRLRGRGPLRLRGGGLAADLRQAPQPPPV